MFDAPAAARPAGPDRFLIGIVVGALVLIAAGVIVVFTAGRTPRSAPADPASPAGVVQGYLEALQAGDQDRARPFLTRSAQAAADRARERFPSPSEPPGMARRFLIEPVRVTDDTAEVKVTISTFSAQSDPFSTSTYHREVTVRLIREDGAWKVSQPVEPYSLLS